jgi:uncharacterized membrane protein
MLADFLSNVEFDMGKLHAILISCLLIRVRVVFLMQNKSLPSCYSRSVSTMFKVNFSFFASAISNPTGAFNCMSLCSGS